MALAVLLVSVIFAIALPAWHVGPVPGTAPAGPMRLSPYLLHLLLLVVTGALVGWRYYNDPNDLLDRLTPAQESVDQLPWLVLSVWVGLLAGMGATWLLGPWRQAYWYQDLQASVSLLAMLGLLVWLLIQIFVSSAVPQGVNMLVFECILLGIVAWYFGARLRS
jgi:hypothetical protein